MSLPPLYTLPRSVSLLSTVASCMYVYTNIYPQRTRNSNSSSSSSNVNIATAGIAASLLFPNIRLCTQSRPVSRPVIQFNAANPPILCDTRDKTHFIVYQIHTYVCIYDDNLTQSTRRTMKLAVTRKCYTQCLNLQSVLCID